MGRTSLLALEPGLVRRGQELLHEQCSLWGADIRRESGNLLIEYGFKRYRPPKELNGCSQYLLELGPHRRICLWGFGLFYGRRRGIHIGRYEFTPRLAYLRENIWSPADLNAGPPLSGVCLLEQTVLWIASYERWIVDVCGPGYRDTCMDREWEELADGLRELRSLAI